MVRKPKKAISSRRGKASKPNLAFVILFLIIFVQAFLLLQFYVTNKTTTDKTNVTQKQKSTSPTTKKLIPAKKHEITSPLPAGPKGKIVIIIDDSGYNDRDCDHLSDIKEPVTISILPELPYSKYIAECATRQGKEVMLHLPLEPHVVRENYPAQYSIKANMSSAQITARLEQALKSVPHVSGINNHEGSKVTEDSRVMYIIFKELAKKNLFFVDSKVTSKSVCRSLADKLRLPFASRDVFLDNESDRAYIEGQFIELAQKARKQGTAIAIGHARDLSWSVMKDQITKLKAQGYEFITVQQLINSKKR